MLVNTAFVIQMYLSMALFHSVANKITCTFDFLFIFWSNVLFRPQAVALLSSEPCAASEKVKLCILMVKRRRDWGGERGQGAHGGSVVFWITILFVKCKFVITYLSICQQPKNPNLKGVQFSLRLQLLQHMTNGHCSLNTALQFPK